MLLKALVMLGLAAFFFVSGEPSLGFFAISALIPGPLGLLLAALLAIVLVVKTVSAHFNPWASAWHEGKTTQSCSRASREFSAQRPGGQFGRVLIRNYRDQPTALRASP